MLVLIAPTTCWPLAVVNGAVWIGRIVAFGYNSRIFVGGRSGSRDWKQSRQRISTIHVAADFINDTRHDIALAPHGTNNRAFCRYAPRGPRTPSLIPMTVFVFAADVGFVNFNDATELFDILNERGSGTL